MNFSCKFQVAFDFSQFIHIIHKLMLMFSFYFRSRSDTTPSSHSFTVRHRSNGLNAYEIDLAQTRRELLAAGQAGNAAAAAAAAILLHNINLR